MELKSPKEFKFEAGGKSYKMYDKISLARKIEQDKLLVEIMNGMTISDQLKDWRKCYDLFNGQKFADGVVVCYNAMERLKAWETKQDPIVKLCCLYLNHLEENIKLVPEYDEKIKDFEAEGIEYAFFLTLAKKLLTTIMNSWSDIFPNTNPEEIENKKEEPMSNEPS